MEICLGAAFSVPQKEMAWPEGKGEKGKRKRKGELRKWHLLSLEAGAHSGPALPEHLP